MPLVTCIFAFPHIQNMIMLYLIILNISFNLFDNCVLGLVLYSCDLQFFFTKIFVFIDNNYLMIYAILPTLANYLFKTILFNFRYFEEEEEPAAPALEYIPAPGSPSYREPANKQPSSDEEDPLDAFMAGLQEHSGRGDKAPPPKGKGKAVGGRGTRGDIEEEDNEESYYRLKFYLYFAY